MIITQLREKLKTNKGRLVFLACICMIISVVFAAKATWAICMTSDRISAQPIEAAQYTVSGVLKKLPDDTETPETIQNADEGVDYQLDVGNVYQLEITVEGNISSGYCTLVFTDAQANALKKCPVLIPSETPTVISFRPEAACSFRYEYCWGVPTEEDAWNGEETVLMTGESKLVSIVLGQELTEEVPETDESSENPEESESETEESSEGESESSSESESETSSQGESETPSESESESSTESESEMSSESESESSAESESETSSENVSGMILENESEREGKELSESEL